MLGYWKNKAFILHVKIFEYVFFNSAGQLLPRDLK
jgi:hypothetical protein